MFIFEAVLRSLLLRIHKKSAAAAFTDSTSKAPHQPTTPYEMPVLGLASVVFPDNRIRQAPSASAGAAGTLHTREK